MPIADFIAATVTVDSAEQLDDLLVTTTRAMGFEHVVYCQVTRYQETGDEAALLAVNTMPEEWVAHYIRSDYSSIDPMIHRARHSARAFLWREAWAGQDLIPRQVQLREESRAVGLAYGVTVPLFGPNGATALISGAGREPELETTAATRAMAALAAQYHLMKEELRDHAPVVPPLVPLTPREREVMTWSARGKSNWAIAEILSLSESSVNFHITNAMRKLDASNRVMAVLKAIRHGLIVP